MDETRILVGGQWKYLYRAVDKLGCTVDFLLTARRDHAAARRFFERAIVTPLSMCASIGLRAHIQAWVQSPDRAQLPTSAQWGLEATLTIRLSDVIEQSSALLDGRLRGRTVVNVDS